jgi:hypothetical protein
MAFIEKKDPIVLNIRLTSKGREELSQGKLNFKYFAIGDSEIDYAFNNETGHIPFNSNILRPTDVNPNILSFITRNLSGDTGYTYNEILSIPLSSYLITNPQQSIGFFTSGCTAFITDSNHVKQPDAMVYMSGVTGGKTLYLKKAPTYGISGEEPAIGDLVLIKWTLNVDTTGHTINKLNPTPFLIYQITGKTGTLSANNLVISIDRELPDFSGFAPTGKAGVLIYYNFINYSGSTIFTDYSTDYLDEAVLTFLQNSQCPTIVFPFWNMSIIYTDEIVGVSGNNRTFGQFNSAAYNGFVSYIQNQAPIYKKLGVIHYTNSSPANVYGEGFYLNTPKLEIPTIMWHKSMGATLGVTLTAQGASKLLTGATTSLNTTYYDLGDAGGNVVGKVFTDLKLFVIEDQELLFAMSYKANRSWTLPDYLVGTTDIITVPCLPTVRWTTPIISNPLMTLEHQYYCHSTCGWTEFPSGTTIALNNVTCTGYKICVRFGMTAGGGTIYVRDSIDDSNICMLSPSIGGPLSYIGKCITGINYPSDHYYGGNWH